MLVHPTILRSASYDYIEIFEKLFPIIYDLLKGTYFISQNKNLKMHLVFAQNNIFPNTF